MYARATTATAVDLESGASGEEAGGEVAADEGGGSDAGKDPEGGGSSSGGDVVRHISEGEAVNASFAENGGQSPKHIVQVEEVP